jgi:hypothetical protein
MSVGLDIITGSAVGSDPARRPGGRPAPIGPTVDAGDDCLSDVREILGAALEPVPTGMVAPA